MDFCNFVANSGKYAKLIYRNGCVYKFKHAGNKVYLTFDDGPTPGVTEWVLETLDKFQAKATFFLLGKNVHQNPLLFEQIKQAGHSYGNHTYNHLKGINVSTTEYLNDIAKADVLIRSPLFRPPYGRVWPKQIKVVKSKGYKVILWTVISCDYNRSLSPRRVFDIVKKRIRPGAIIVFHDSLKAERNMRFALTRILEEFSGIYEFDKIYFDTER
jgi:peptidoglycan/xylan/chitin deacetylase (PgdA/CDA1 family)